MLKQDGDSGARGQGDGENEAASQHATDRLSSTWNRW